jgi:hypothetical protein
MSTYTTAITSAALGLGIASSLVAIAPAEAFTFNFADGDWSHTVNGQTVNSTGWLGGATSGSITIDGITLSVTSSLSGTAETRDGRNLVEHTGEDSKTKGFSLSNKSKRDIYSGGNLNSYQRLDFSFSSAVNLSNFVLGDIDAAAVDKSFVDAVGAEGFSGGPGAAGTGLAALFSYAENTRLKTETVQTADGSLNFAVRDVAKYGLANSLSASQDEAYLAFDGPIDSFSLYFFNDTFRKAGGSARADQGHAITMFGGTATPPGATGAPEPFSIIGSGVALALGGMARRRNNKVIS